MASTSATLEYVPKPLSITYSVTLTMLCIAKISVTDSNMDNIVLFTECKVSANLTQNKKIYMFLTYDRVIKHFVALVVCLLTENAPLHILLDDCIFLLDLVIDEYLLKIHHLAFYLPYS